MFEFSMTLGGVGNVRCSPPRWADGSFWCSCTSCLPARFVVPELLTARNVVLGRTVDKAGFPNSEYLSICDFVGPPVPLLSCSGIRGTVILSETFSDSPGHLLHDR